MIQQVQNVSFGTLHGLGEPKNAQCVRDVMKVLRSRDLACGNENSKNSQVNAFVNCLHRIDYATGQEIIILMLKKIVLHTMTLNIMFQLKMLMV